MKYCYKTLILISIGLVAGLVLNAQDNVKETSIKNIRGVAIGGINESVGQLIQNAISKAKIEALKKAGIEENIASYTDYFQSESDKNYDEFFTSDILSDIRGAIKDVEIIDTIKKFDEFGNLSIEVGINCTVIKYLTEKDISFDAWIDGVGMYYQNGTKLIFKAKTSKNAYVNIFIFNDTEAYKLFPNDLEKSYLLAKDQYYVFPNPDIDYTLETNKKFDPHRMIMVFT